jgi:hypothetical protein
MTQVADGDALGPDALDFWLGDWDVTWGEAGSGRNRITREVGDRVIVERFEGHGPRIGDVFGTSISVREDDGRWHQAWADSSGGYLDLTGVEVDGRISFQLTTVEDGVTITRRMVWLDVEPDAMRWEWQETRDGGGSWTTLWPIRYRRR